MCFLSITRTRASVVDRGGASPKIVIETLVQARAMGRVGGQGRG